MLCDTETHKKWKKGISVEKIKGAFSLAVMSLDMYSLGEMYKSFYTWNS